METERAFQPTIRLYCDQHSRALQCTQNIAALLGSPAEVKANANEIRLLLAYLAGVLKPHFTSEDRLLYPTLIASHDQKISEVASRFWDEMGGITKSVESFLVQWRTLGEIEKHPGEFAAACQALFQALKNRIDAEERELYPLFLENN